MTKLPPKASKPLLADPNAPLRSRARKPRDPAQPQLALDPMPARIEPALALIGPDRIGLDIRLAYCWAHARRKLVEIARNGSAPIAEDGIRRVGELYRIEAELRGLDPEARVAGRQERSAPLIADMQT